MSKQINAIFYNPYYRGIGTIATKNPLIRQFALMDIQALSLKELRTARKLGYPITRKKVIN